ncbi:MAG TPA: ArgR family transcriptional regulator [Bryobacteraceae bacterium]|jgi:transcriptional regulator of arginine metabolism|nr:ArgR family transcriptional regulator [Bryobacteraceae bacterium]
MNKSYRQGQILKLVRSRSVRTQEELARALRGVGVRATQVTLSRDIRELGLVKTAEGYARPTDSAAPAGPELATVLRDFLLDVRVAQNVLVLITPPAHASSVAEALDRAAWPEITGTVAGDNTVLVIAPTARKATGLREKLLRFLG